MYRFMILVVSALAVTACAETLDDGEASELRVVTSALSPDTDVVLFQVSGDGIGRGGRPYLGRRGSIPDNTLTSTSTASFRVPEGEKEVTAYGYDQFSPAGALPFPAQAYELRESCLSGPLSLQSRTVITVTTVCADPGPGAFDLGADTLILNGDYVFDPGGPYGGSFDGSNVAVLVVDGAAPDTVVSVAVSGSFLGCFTTLPAAGAWPDPSTGWDNCNAGNTDASGDAIRYLVAMPGSSGTVSSNSVVIGGDVMAYAVRIAGIGGINGVTD